MATKTAKPKKPVPDTPHLFDRVRDILESAQSNIACTVNSTQVVANIVGSWQIGILNQDLSKSYYRSLLRVLRLLVSPKGKATDKQNLQVTQKSALEKA